MEELKNFINGELRAPVSGSWLDNWSPATGEVYSKVADSDERDVALAVKAALAAAPDWAATPAAERARKLRAVARTIEAQLDKFALAESIDTGKPVALASSVDIPRSIQNFDFFADAATQFASEAHVMDGQAINYTIRHPLGAVACISPWNLPLYLLSWKIAPALAAGNTVVAKPSEVTPMTASLLAKVCLDAGLPPGVLNIVHGAGPKTGAALVNDSDISAVSFTGSTRVGAEIARAAAGRFKKVSLEMGGKNATIVFADCDFEPAVEQTLRAAFSNQGQICLCGSRILVERSIYEKFREALTTRARALKIGDPMVIGTDQGAVVSKPHFDKVLASIALAKQEGGRVLCGGQSVKLEGRCRNGWFIAPTLIEGLGPTCRTNQEEIFGPVATLMPFSPGPGDDEALALANSTRYGLSASVWTRDLARAHSFSARLRTGIVWVNTWMLRDLRTPFGGVRESGVGREGGLDAMRFFTEPQNICVKT